MSRYGHNSIRIGNDIFIDGWGAGPYIIFASGKKCYFEDSARLGPVPLDPKTGDPSDNLWFFLERSPFWAVWERWKAEGRETVDGKQPRSMRKGWLYCKVSNGRSAT